MATPMQVQDAVQRIQLAFREKDFFRLMGLPQPEADELGNPVWSCTSADVSKAYRRLSVVVHPDKNPGEEARTAFDQLNQAHKALKDPGQLEDHLRRAADGARRRRDAAEAAATPDERIALNAAKAERQKALRKQQAIKGGLSLLLSLLLITPLVDHFAGAGPGAQFQAEIARQLAEKKAAAKRKREVAARSRQRAEEDTGGLSEEDRPTAPQKALAAGSDDDDTVIIPVRKRGKKKAML
eukprot:jgi/Astpho2/6319/fgenesh1_pg.00090_%23_10_t